MSALKIKTVVIGFEIKSCLTLQNATIGSAVYQVVASDPDDPTQPSGQLFYSIQPSNPDAKIFAIGKYVFMIFSK